MPYSQEEVAEQIGQIADLMKMREKVNQPIEEAKRLTDSIAVSQEVLAFMLDENVIRIRGKRERAI